MNRGPSDAGPLCWVPSTSNAFCWVSISVIGDSFHQTLEYALPECGHLLSLAAKVQVEYDPKMAVREEFRESRSKSSSVVQLICSCDSVDEAFKIVQPQDSIPIKTTLNRVLHPPRCLQQDLLDTIHAVIAQAVQIEVLCALEKADEGSVSCRRFFESRCKYN